MRVMVYPIIEIVIGSYVYTICICILPLLILGLCAYISSNNIQVWIFFQISFCVWTHLVLNIYDHKS